MVTAPPEATAARLARGIILLLLILGSGACTALHPRPTPPDLSRLEPGDILVTFWHSPEIWILASAGASELPRTPYDHGEILAQEKGQWHGIAMSDGSIRQREFIDSLDRFSHLAVFRAKSPRAARQDAADTAMRWVDDPNLNKIKFDYTLRDVPGRRDQFYCIGLINEICRDSELPAPFRARVTGARQGAIAWHLSVISGTSLHKTAVAQSIVDNPQYERVLYWENDRFSDQARWLSRQTAQATIEFYDQGWWVKERNEGLIPLFLEGAGMLPKESQQAYNCIRGLKAFGAEVSAVWSRLERRGKLEALSEQERIDLHRQICLKYRNPYFEKAKSTRTR